MDFQPVNMDAVEDALRLIGGDNLLAIVTSVYDAINKAELRGQKDAFSEGHAIGLIDGRAQLEQELFEDGYAKANAHVEGFSYAEDFPEVFEDPHEHDLHRHADDGGRHPEDQPSDEGLAGLSEHF